MNESIDVESIYNTINTMISTIYSSIRRLIDDYFLLDN